MELLSPIRARISTFKTLETRKFGAPFSVACCASGPAQDEEGPFVSSDWRAFRAALVARQRAPLSSTEPPITIGDKWAHTIYEPERGCLLIATEKLDGVHIFERTVILLLSTGPVGPTGLILNRPSLMSIKEMRWSAVDASGPFSEKALFFGGPLEEGLFLVSPRGGGGGGGVERSGVVEKVMEGVYYGTKESAGCAAEMVKRSVVEAEEFRFFHGYCAWEGEQLRDEIRAGYWTVAACSPAVIQQTSAGGVGLWGEILGLMGPKKVW